MTTTTLRILIVTRGLPFHVLGGMEAVAWDLSRAFVNLGAQVTVLTTSCASLPGDGVVEGVRIVCLRAASGRYSRAWWRESKRAYVEQFTTRCDIVLSVSAGARSMASARADGRPVFVVQAHGTAWGEFISKIRLKSPVAWLKSARNLVAMFEDVAFRRFDAFIAVGDAVEEDLTRRPTRYITGNLPVYLIANGITVERFAFDAGLRGQLRAKLGLDKAAKVILSASRLHPQKGVMESIEGFLLAVRENASLHYVIAGAGPDEARLRARANAAGWANSIHFVGNIPRDELRAWLSAADIFIFTTKRIEGLPLNILEARAAGLPVIASEQVSDPRFGNMSVNPNDPVQVSNAILACANAKPESRRSILAEEFTLEHAARAYLKLFGKLISNG